MLEGEILPRLLLEDETVLRLLLVGEALCWLLTKSKASFFEIDSTLLVYVHNQLVITKYSMLHKLNRKTSNTCVSGL